MGNKIFMFVFNSDPFLCYESLFFISLVSPTPFFTAHILVHKNNIFELK